MNDDLQNRQVKALESIAESLHAIKSVLGDIYNYGDNSSNKIEKHIENISYILKNK